jgi:hypothetical protein
VVFATTVNEYELLVLTTLPERSVQLLNVNPTFGVSLTVHNVPDGMLDADPDTVPAFDPDGNTTALTKYVGGAFVANCADKLSFEVIVNVYGLLVTPLDHWTKWKPLLGVAVTVIDRPHVPVADPAVTAAVPPVPALNVNVQCAIGLFLYLEIYVTVYK